MDRPVRSAIRSPSLSPMQQRVRESWRALETQTQRFHAHASFLTRPDPVREALLMLSHSANQASHHLEGSDKEEGSGGKTKRSNKDHAG